MRSVICFELLPGVLATQVITLQSPPWSPSHRLDYSWFSDIFPPPVPLCETEDKVNKLLVDPKASYAYTVSIHCHHSSVSTKCASNKFHSSCFHAPSVRSLYPISHQTTKTSQQRSPFCSHGIERRTKPRSSLLSPPLSVFRR